MVKKSFSRFIFTAFGLALIASALFVPTGSFAATERYCLALRGNGELAPAHWGALSQVVERVGLPQAMSGGSSASISLFLLESIALNSSVTATANENSRREAASLLLKSLEGYLGLVASDPQWNELKQVVAYIKQASGAQSMEFMAWLQLLAKTPPTELESVFAQNGAAIQNAFKRGIELGVLNAGTFAPLETAIKKLMTRQSDEERLMTMQTVGFLASEIYQSFVLLGKFNAESDQNLFFRSGVVNFETLAHNFGRVANFYAEREMPMAVRDDLRSFIATCAPLARGKTWNELRVSAPSCERDFYSVLNAYRATGLPSANASRELDTVGSAIPSFPTTAVLTGAAAQSAMMSLILYPQSLDAAFGRGFKVNADDVAFGYWGRKKSLTRIAKNLKTPFTDRKGNRWDFSDDEKSRRFLSLGESPWLHALRASPAEPGLAPLQKLSETKNGQMLYSAGGWSDLHPSAVLKAAGCEKIVYVTRRGGESLFGQGVAKRLFGFPEVPWERLSTDATHKAANVIRNNVGDKTDMTSQWSRLYNLANPGSSLNRALNIADAVVCTDWNRFDIQDPGAVSSMIGEAYRASWAVRDSNSPFAKTLSAAGTTLITPDQNSFDSALGYRPYAGCLAF